MAYKIKYVEQLEELRKLQPMGWSNMSAADVECFNLRINSWREAMRAMVVFMDESSINPYSTSEEVDEISKESYILLTSF